MFQGQMEYRLLIHMSIFNMIGGVKACLIIVNINIMMDKESINSYEDSLILFNFLF